MLHGFSYYNIYRFSKSTASLDNIPLNLGNNQEFVLDKEQILALDGVDLESCTLKPNRCVVPILIILESIESDYSIYVMAGLYTFHGSDTYNIIVTKERVIREGKGYIVQQVYGLGASQGITKNQEISEYDKLCVVCLTEPRTAVLVPCNHLCLCDNCATMMLTHKKCPICRTIISTVVKLS